MKHREPSQLEALQGARPQHRSSPQAITRQSWEPIAQPARRRQRTADPAFKNADPRDLEVYERYVGRWLDKFSAKQHRSFDQFPAQLERLFSEHLRTLPDEVKRAIERVITL